MVIFTDIFKNSFERNYKQFISKKFRARQQKEMPVKRRGIAVIQPLPRCNIAGTQLREEYFFGREYLLRLQ